LVELAPLNRRGGFHHKRTGKIRNFSHQMRKRFWLIVHRKVQPQIAQINTPDYDIRGQADFLSHEEHRFKIL
jgi:hypothetical protein